MAVMSFIFQRRLPWISTSVFGIHHKQYALGRPVGGEGSSRTVEGAGDMVIPIEGNPRIVSAVIQKKTTRGDLTVQIRKDGEVVGEGETTASYGVVTLTG